MGTICQNDEIHSNLELDRFDSAYKNRSGDCFCKIKPIEIKEDNEHEIENDINFLNSFNNENCEDDSYLSESIKYQEEANEAINEFDIKNNNERNYSASTSDSSLINVKAKNSNFDQILIIFKGDVEFSKVFDRKIKLKEMFKILKENNIINSFNKEKVIISYNSIILNMSFYLEKPLYKIFGYKNNVIIGIFRTEKMIG